MKKFLGIICFLGFLLTVCAGQFTLNVSGKGAVYVPFPNEWKNPVVTSVDGGNDWKLNCVGGRAAGIALSEMKGEVTVLINGDGASPVSQSKPPCVMVERRSMVLTTRPFTAEEMVRLFSRMSGHRKQPVHTAYVDIVGKRPSGDKWQHSSVMQKRGNLVDCWHWQAGFSLEHEAELFFGCDTIQTGWTVLVDAEPVANWRGAREEEGAFWGETVQLAAGWHTIQLLVVQNANETLPVLRCKSGMSGSAPMEFFPVRRPDTLSIVSEKSTYSIEMKRKESFRLGQTLEGWSSVEFQTKGDIVSLTASTVSGADIGIRRDGTAIVPINEFPTLKASNASDTFTVDGQKLAVFSRVIDGRIRWKKTPVISSDGNCKVSLGAEFSGNMKALTGLLQWKIRAIDDDGNLAYAETHELQSLEETEATVVFGRAFAGGKITASLELLGQPLFAPMELRMVSPGKFTSIFPVGEYLTQEGEHCVLLVPSTALKPIGGKMSEMQIAVLEDDIQGGSELFGRLGLKAVRRKQWRGVAEIPAYIGDMLALSESNAQAAVIDLERMPEELSLAEKKVLLEYLVHLFFAKGLLPFLVTIPGEVASEEFDLSLFAKRLALNGEFPCADLYSQAVIETISREKRQDYVTWKNMKLEAFLRNYICETDKEK